MCARRGGGGGGATQACHYLPGSQWLPAASVHQRYYEGHQLACAQADKGLCDGHMTHIAPLAAARHPPPPSARQSGGEGVRARGLMFGLGNGKVTPPPPPHTHTHTHSQCGSCALIFPQMVNGLTACGDYWDWCWLMEMRGFPVISQSIYSSLGAMIRFTESRV